MEKLNFAEKFQKFEEYWTPKIVSEMNGQFVKLAKGKGEIVWHTHENEDEFFYVMKGQLNIHFHDRVVNLNSGEGCIVPKGVKHKASAKEETHFMLIEPKSTEHTGKVESEQTVAIEDQTWI